MGFKEKYINLIKNMGVFAISNFSVKVITFLVLPLYTYYLTTDEYAVVDLVNSTAQLLLPFLSLCMTDAVLRFGISSEYDKREVFSSGCTVVLVGTLILPLVLFIFHDRIQLNGVEIYFVIIYIFQVINSICSAFFKAIDKVKSMAVITMISSIAIVFLNVLFVAVLQRGVKGYLTSVILGNAIGTVLYILGGKLYQYYRVSLVRKAVLKEMLKYAVPLIPNAVFWWINTSLDKYALTALTSLSVVGLYSVANKIPTIISTVTSIFSQAWNLSAFQAYDDTEREAFYKKTYEMFQAVMVVCTSGVILFSRIFAHILFAKDFYHAWVFVPILTLGVYYNSLNSFLGSLFTASKKTKYIFYTTGMGAGINVVFNILLIKTIGPQGAAIATLVSYLVVWGVRNYKVREVLAIHFDIKKELIFLILLLVQCWCMIMNAGIGMIASTGICGIIVISRGNAFYKMVKGRVNGKR